MLIEFGGRTTTVPSEERVIIADMAPVMDGLQFPEATVKVLSAERTFWKKVTLIHAENGRRAPRPHYERWARHWYDLARRELLESVVAHKKVFYYSADADYDACVAGAVRLVAEEQDLMARLRADYEAMIASGMFLGEPPAFDDIVARLVALERAINAPPN